MNMELPVYSLVFTEEQFSKDKGIVVVDAEEWFEYDEVNKRKSDKLLGMKYECALPAFNHKRIIVKVKGNNSNNMITKQDISEANFCQIPVRFEGFEARIYMNDYKKKPGLSCKADFIDAV